MNNERSKAEEDLRVIRSLMERATVYRAISAPAALVAGLLSIFAAGAIYRRPVHGRVFADVWLIVLALAVVDECIFYLARSQGPMAARLFSSGMKLALRAIAPKPAYSGSGDRLVFHNRLQRRG